MLEIVEKDSWGLTLKAYKIDVYPPQKDFVFKVCVFYLEAKPEWYRSL